MKGKYFLDCITMISYWKVYLSITYFTGNDKDICWEHFVVGNQPNRQRVPRRLRGVLVERGAAKPRQLRPRPGSRFTRSARTVCSLSRLHPDSQRPLSLPPPWIGGLGSALPLGTIASDWGSSWEEISIAFLTINRSNHRPECFELLISGVFRIQIWVP